jgi:hypothetical protein
MLNSPTLSKKLLSDEMDKVRNKLEEKTQSLSNINN